MILIHIYQNSQDGDQTWEKLNKIELDDQLHYIWNIIEAIDKDSVHDLTPPKTLRTPSILSD